MPQDEEPHSPPSSAAAPPAQNGKSRHTVDSGNGGGLAGWVKKFFRQKNAASNGDHLREALEEYIEEMDNRPEESVASHEKSLITNVLKMRDLTVVDVMIPRPDIAAIPVNASQDQLMQLLSEKQYSRIPVYRESLDDVLGTVHIKDILACVAAGRAVRLPEMIRDVPVVSPAMPVLDLLLLMKESRKHMALVVDEFGGIDGLATIGDVIEAIIGEVDDEFDREEQPQIVRRADGTLLVDARVDIEEFEEQFGNLLSEDEREDADTLGGLVFSIAGRVPARGEVIKHDSGMIFEIVDADPRRVNTLRIKNIPAAGYSG